jgi:zinc protease
MNYRVGSDECLEGFPGTAHALEHMMFRGTSATVRTAALDRLAFQKALDDIGAEESPGADFSVDVMASDFERGVELLADNELRPALPEGSFKIARQELAESVAGELRSPGYLRRHALNTALLPSGDRSLRHAAPETVSALTIADVRDYRQRVSRPDPTTIVVIGQVSPDKACSVIERYFGAWKADGAQPETLVPPNKPSNSVLPNASRVQDEVTLAETVELNRANPDYYELNLGNQVLGGAFYASRRHTPAVPVPCVACGSVSRSSIAPRTDVFFMAIILRS